MTDTQTASDDDDRKVIPIFVTILAIFTVSTAVVVGILSWMSTIATQHAVHDGVAGSALSATQIEADQIAGAVRFAKVEDIEDKLEKFLQTNVETGIGTVVIGAEGDVLATTGEIGESRRDEITELAARSLSTGETVVTGNGMEIGTPIRFGKDSTVVGALAAIWTTDVVMAAARQEMYRQWAISAAVFAVLLTLTAIFLKRHLARPITALAGRTLAMADGDLASEIPGTERRDEIGMTGAALERLRAQLETADAASRDAIIAGAAFRASSTPLFLLDLEHRVTQMNGAAEALAEGSGADPGRFLSGLEGLDLPLLSAAPLPAERDVTKDGRTFALTLGDIRQDGGRIGYVAEVVDVTEERRDRATLEALDTCMLRAEFGADGHLLRANSAFEALGSHTDELKARPFWTVLETPGELPALERVARDGKTFTGRLGLGRGNTAILDGAIASARGRGGDISGYVLLASDVTDQQRELDRAEEHRALSEARQARVVDRLSKALAQLSSGDLTTRLEHAFEGEYETLREDFNSAIAALDTAVVQVLDRAVAIKGETDNISGAAEDLSRRTEQQAATLEEFAAALTEITESVASAAEGASKADEVVIGARKNAEASGEIVREAVSAMSEISTSSQQVSKIIGVIDDIAFQTNLLALNAGVEAARAGDAGRGFAVVASEVRALAQRSSEAAREINELISASGRQVQKGVSLVDKTGDTLKEIVNSVREIADLVGNIAISSREQTNGLKEINGAMSQLDQVTQQNVAMFEETSAATRLLSDEADSLTHTTARFTTSGSAVLPPSSARGASEADWDVDRTVSQTPLRHGIDTRSAIIDGALALAEPAEDDWEEF